MIIHTTARNPNLEWSTMKTIGILGGLGPESTISYYACITRTYHELRGDYGYPDILIYSLSFQKVIDSHYEQPVLVQRAIRALHAAGADFVVAACNSIHVVYDDIKDDLPIPWVSIMAPTADAIRGRNLTKVALLGTLVTMGQDFYRKEFAARGIDLLTPPANEQERINGIIFDELVIGRVTEDSRAYVQQCIERLRERGAQGVVLGCTELPFLIEARHTDLPVFDTTSIHARRALDLALEEDGGL